MIKKPVSAIVNIPKIQPHGGFIPPKDMAVKQFESKTNNYEQLIGVISKLEEKTLSPQSFGLVFDYLLRTEMAIIFKVRPAEAVIDAFKVSFLGASEIDKFNDAKALAFELIKCYSVDDWKSRLDYLKVAQIASELVVYDAVFRAGYYNPDAQPPKVSNGDKEELELMLRATEYHLLKNEDVIEFGFGFTAEGAENLLPSDGDILTKTSIIDIKCSKNEPTSKHTLQLLLYYILGLHERPSDFKTLQYIKILNPRLGKVYSYEIAKVSVETFKHIESDIMGYRESVF